MPSVQRGGVDKLGKRRYRARWYDEDRRRHARGGFETECAAWAFLDDKVKEIAALRRGDILPTSDRVQTIDDLVDLFLDKHGRTIDPATKSKLTRQLKHARAEFGTRHPD